jgi:uncharacterized membrane protein SpoIIM required for sporulation
MTITEALVLLLPAIIGAASAGLLFQIADRYLERRNHRKLAEHKQHAAAA